MTCSGTEPPPHLAGTSMGVARPSAFEQWPQSMRRGVHALVLIACGCTLYLRSTFLLPVRVAGTMALLLSPAVTAPARLHTPQPLAAGVVMLLVLSSIGTLAVNIAAPVQRWIDTAPEHLRRLEAKLTVPMRPVTAVREATEKVSEIAQADNDKIRSREVVVERRPAPARLNTAMATLVTALSTVMLLYFLLASGDLLLRKLSWATPCHPPLCHFPPLGSLLGLDVGNRGAAASGSAVGRAAHLCGVRSSAEPLGRPTGPNMTALVKVSRP